MTPAFVTSVVAIVLFAGGLFIGLSIAWAVVAKLLNVLADWEYSNNLVTGMLSATSSEKLFRILSTVMIRLYLREPRARCFQHHGVVVLIKADGPEVTGEESGAK